MKSVEIPAPEGTQKKKRPVTVILQIFLSVLILGGGVVLTGYYLKTGPEAKPKKRTPSPPLVQVESVHYGTHQFMVSGMGTVLAAKEISLTPGVGGEIIKMSENMVPGGFFMENETLVTIDPLDYQLAITRLQSEVAKAQNDLDLEMGNQLVAQKELEAFQILGQEVTNTEKKLMLRTPQLAIKKATLQGAKATLAQAEVNLKRTEVHAPFNGIVLSRSVNLGTRIAESTILAGLVGTDEFWLKLAIPTNQLQWISFPDGNNQGSQVRIFLQEKTDDAPFRIGRVIRLAADVEEKGRMATVYVAIEDPLCLLPKNNKKPKILLGSFVLAEIEGIELASVVAISRDHLRENDSIWILKEDSTLEIRDVNIVARTNDQILIESGLDNGDQLIVSGLSSPVAGTPVQRMPKEQDPKDIDATVADDKRAKKGVTTE